MADITEAFVRAYHANLVHNVQQMESRFRSAVRIETAIRGEDAAWEQLGAQTSKKKTARNSDSPINQPNLTRRWVTMFDFELGNLHDVQDQLKMLLDPTSTYIQSQAMALSRDMDDECIKAASGTALTDKTGSTSTTLPSGQKIVAGGNGLTIGKLITAKEILDASEVPENDRFCGAAAGQISDLLNTPEITSADFNTVRSLVRGDIDTFLGFKFIRTQRLETDGNSDRLVLCWQRDGILLAISKDITARVVERADKSFATYVYACISIGATRMEEERIVQIACVE